MIFKLGFIAFRVLGLIQLLAGYVLLTILKPHPVKNPDMFLILNSLYMSGLMAFYSKSLDDLPCKDILIGKIDLLGKLVLIILLVIIIKQILILTV